MNHITKDPLGRSLGTLSGIDTTFVLFFLALEYGRAVQMLSIDGILMGITILMVLVLPYFLPSNQLRPAFSAWVAGRVLITLFGISLGFAFDQSLGVVLPESLRYMPMTFLILASMVSCYVQFYGLLKLRPVK